nr:KH domain-containing protein [Tanacetum cinerariifolium]
MDFDKSMGYTNALKVVAVEAIVVVKGAFLCLHEGYQNYPPQQLRLRNNHVWEQRPPTNMQGPPDQRGYDYYGGPPSAQPPMHFRAPGPAMGPPSQANYNYGQTQGPDYRQQPAPYSDCTTGLRSRLWGTKRPLGIVGVYDIT